MQDWVHVEQPDGDGPFPVIVFFHHGPGFDAGSEEAARMIADQGYFVVAPDRYRRFEPWTEETDRERRMEMFVGTTDEHVEEDVGLILSALADEPAARDGRMGCIGYCIGGRSVLRTMANHPDVFTGGVGLHPSMCVTDDANSPHLAVPGLPGQLYLGFGAEDQMQSVAMHQPLIEATGELGDRGIVEIHEGADHGFAVPGSERYHEAAARRSYDQAFALWDRAVR